jgi:hypothetical protein
MASSAADGANGAFTVDSPEPGWRLALICSDGTDGTPEGSGWEHVSVHAYRTRKTGRTIILGYDVGKPEIQARTPTWAEMAFVKALCWDDEDVVMQLHPARASYVNVHPHVLHLWRPRHATIPTPPVGLV